MANAVKEVVGWLTVFKLFTEVDIVLEVFGHMMMHQEAYVNSRVFAL